MRASRASSGGVASACRSRTSPGSTSALRTPSATAYGRRSSCGRASRSRFPSGARRPSTVGSPAGLTRSGLAICSPLNSRNRRPSRTVAVAALACFLGFPEPGAAVDVKLWPLFRYASSGAQDELHWTALGPFVEFTRTAETRDLYVRPLLHLHQQRGATPGDRADILYPLAASRWDPDHESFRFLLFTYRRTPEPGTAHAPGAPPPPAEWPSRFTLFPFIFYRQSPERGVRLSVLPFYFDLDDFLGYDRVTAVMFPVYLRLEEPRVVRRFYGFPFVSTVGGSDGRGVRVFPFYGRSDVGGVSSRFYLWPAYRRKTQDVDDFHYRRDDVGMVVWRRQSLRNETSGHRERLLTLLGVLRRDREDGQSFGQTPALADSLLPKNRGVLTLWAPIYGLFRWETAADGSEDWNALWGLVARENGHLLGPMRFD